MISSTATSCRPIRLTKTTWESRLVYPLRVGVTARMIKKPKPFPIMFIMPHGVASPKPSLHTYSTASSYAMYTIGILTNPIKRQLIKHPTGESINTQNENIARRHNTATTLFALSKLSLNFA